MIDRELPGKNVAEKRDRLQIAAQPALVDGGDDGNAALDLVARNDRQRIAHHEYGRSRVGRKSVVALCGAASDLQVHALIIEALPGDQIVNDCFPLRVAVRIGEPDSVETALQARQMLR